MKYHIDNSNNPDWPLVTITNVIPEDKTLPDYEPYQERLQLSCGHHCIYTHGAVFTPYKVGDTLHCKTCGEK